MDAKLKHPEEWEVNCPWASSCLVIIFEDQQMTNPSGDW